MIFDLVETLTFDTNGRKGRLYFPLEWDQTVQVSEGDLFSFNKGKSTGHLAGGNVYAGSSCGGEFGYHNHLKDIYIDGLNNNPAAEMQLFRAIIMKPESSLIRWNFPEDTSWGVHNITFALSNYLNHNASITLETSITVVDYLFNISVDVPLYGKLTSERK